MNPRIWIVCGALLGATGVALGAMGAHLLQDRKIEDFWYRLSDDTDYLGSEIAQKAGPYIKGRETYETAVRYQMYHALALVAAGVTATLRKHWAAHAAGLLFLVGVGLFSGSLYGLFFIPTFRWLGAVAPLGGTSLILGWLFLAYAHLGSVDE